MLTRWSDFDRDFARNLATLGALARRMDEMFAGFEQPQSFLRALSAGTATWPRTNVYDAGEELLIEAAVPGLTEKEIQLAVTGDVLTISGERQVEAPKGYSVHRQERGSVKFSRSFTLPSKIDIEKVSASVKDGVLIIRLPKAAEAKPRQITVKASQ